MTGAICDMAEEIIYPDDDKMYWTRCCKEQRPAKEVYIKRCPDGDYVFCRKGHDVRCRHDLSERIILEHLLTKGEIVNSRRIARELDVTVYEVSGVMKMLKGKGIVEHIRTRKWRVNREKAERELVKC